MKLAVTCLASVSGLSCWTCNGSDPNQCKLAQCPEDGQVYSCQNEIRMYGAYVTFNKGCQQQQACLNNAKQNEVPGTGEYYQCNPYRKRDSVCRCCCHTDGCNEMDHFCAKPPHCRRPIVANGAFNCDAETMGPGAQCTVECDPGYEVTGPATIECTDQADDVAVGMLAWSQPQWPQCTPKSCPKESLPNIKNGQIKCWNGHDVNQHCSVQCDVGYHLSSESESTLVCGANQDWLGTPECIPTPTCESRSLDLTSQFVSCSNGNLDGSICHFSCDAGYELDGARSVDCFEGEWSNQFPRCTPTCTPQFNGTRRDVNCSNKYAIDSTCSFKCKDGWSLVGQSAITCRAEEETVTVGLGGNQHLAAHFEVTVNTKRVKANWSAPSPICEPTQCPELDLTQFTRADCSAENNVGSKCSFTCEDGYEVDSVSIECGDSGTWSGVTPVCKQIVEDKPIVKRPVKSKCDQIDSGILSLKCSNGFFQGSECAFVCPNGYKIDGQKSTVCLNTLKWTPYTLPGCLYRVRLTVAQAAKLTSMRPYMKSNGDFNGVEPKSSDAGDDVELNLTDYIADHCLGDDDVCLADSTCAAELRDALGEELMEEVNLFIDSKCN